AGGVDDRDRPQRQAFLVDAELAARVEHQRAVKLVGPAVIGTDQAMGAAGLSLADLRATVATDIVKRANLARAVAYHDDRFGADPVREEVTRPGDLERIAREQPMPVKNPRQIGLEDLPCDVEIPSKRPVRLVLGDQPGDFGRKRATCHARRAVHSRLLAGPAYHAALALPQTHVKVL